MCILVLVQVVKLTHRLEPLVFEFLLKEEINMHKKIYGDLIVEHNPL